MVDKMSKDIDNENEWGIDDISEVGDSPIDKKIEVDGQTRAFGGRMPDKEVTADLTNVISSQIIIDAVKNGTAEDDYVEDYSVDAKLYTEDYTEEFMTSDIEEALEYTDEAEGLEVEEEYYEEDENPEYYDEEEPIDEMSDDYYDDSYDTAYDVREEKPVKNRHSNVTNKSNSNNSGNSSRKVNLSGDDSDDGDGNDKMFLIISIIVFIVIVILGIFLLSKLHNGSKPGGDIDFEDEIDTDTGLLDAANSQMNSGNMSNTGSDNSNANNSNTGNTGSGNNNQSGNNNSNGNQNNDDNKNNDKPAAQTACEKDGHKFADATCTEPKTCTVCGKKEGNALGHDFVNADCTKPTTCTRCGQTGTDALGHTYTEATCTEPKKCTRCGATEGEALGHDYEEATCEKPATCKRCKETKGEKGEHKFEEVSSTMTGDKKTVTYKCSVCGETKTEDGKVDPGPMTDEQKVAKIVELVNAERASAGLPALTTTPELTKAANARAKEIATSFSHSRPDGRDAFTVLSDYGISYTTCGENMAAGQKTPEEVVNSWMGSSTHKANILNANYTHIGIGYYNSGSGYTYYWVQMFTD